MLIGDTIFEFIQIDFLLVIPRFIADHEHISRKIILNASNAAHKVTEIHISHLRTSAVITRYEQIIRRKIDPLNQSAGTKHCRNFFSFE